MSEFMFEPPDNLLSFFGCSFFMTLHGQKYKIRVFASFMSGQEVQSFCYQLNVFFVAGNDKSVKNLLPVLSQWLVLLVLFFLGPADYPAVFDHEDKISDTEH